jgi:hypothetical protein
VQRARFEALARLLLALCLGLVVVAVPSSAWALPSETPDDTWQVNGPVRAIARYGDTIFIGGDFTRLRQRPMGVQDPNARRVSNLAALNANTGAPARGVDVPNFTGPGSIIYALTVADGKVWIGGRFTAADGRERHNLASIDAATGALRGFSPTVNGAVMALADDGSKVYAGGMFTRVNQQSRRRLAAFSVATGRLRPWAPSANGRVRDMSVTPDKNGLFITGVFSSVRDPDGSSHARNAIARLATTGGWVDDWRPGGGPYSDKIIGMGINTYAGSPGRVYWAVGGSDWAAAFTISNGNRIFKTDTDGTVGDVVEMGDRVIIGGHFVLVAPRPFTSSCASDPKTCERHVRIAALRRDGVLDQSWDPKLQGNGVEWEGAKRFLVQKSKLWIVGEFLEITDVDQNYVGRLS